MTMCKYKPNASCECMDEKECPAAAVVHLQKLCNALNNAYISSWQTIAAWQKELDAATLWLEVQPKAKKDAGILTMIADKIMGSAPREPKYKVGQTVRYQTDMHQPTWADGGQGFGKIEKYSNGHYTINGNPVNHFDIKEVMAFNGLHFAVIGQKHFGNPIPPEWYAAAKELQEELLGGK